MTKHELETWLKTKLAARLRVSPDGIDIYRPLDEIGLDSVEAVTLTGDLEALLGRRIEPTALWDHRTIFALTAFLSGEVVPGSMDITRGMSDEEVDVLLRKLAGSPQ